MRTEPLAWPPIPQLLGSKEDLPPSPQGHFSLSLMKSHCSDEASVLPPRGCWLIRGCIKKPSKDLLKSGKGAACSPRSLCGALCPLCSSSVSPCFLITLRGGGGDTTGIGTWVPLMHRTGESNCVLDFVSLP